MADVRINALATTATSSSSDDFIAIDGSANGTRKLSAYSPTFGGNLTVSGTGTNAFTGDIALTRTTGNPLISITNGASGSFPLFQFFDVRTGGFNWNIEDGRTLGTLGFFCDGATRFSITNAGNATLAGNLTVSGTGLSSAAGTLFVGSSSPVDSGNGKLQLATHTTSAGGIGFGTDVSLFRDGANSLFTTATSLGFPNNGQVIFGGSGFISTLAALTLRTGGSLTTALTLDSSQNATFAGNATISKDQPNFALTNSGTGGTTWNTFIGTSTGTFTIQQAGVANWLTIEKTTGRVSLTGPLKLGNAYTASVVVPTGYVTIQDSTGTTYKVCVLL